MTLQAVLEALPRRESDGLTEFLGPFSRELEEGCEFSVDVEGRLAGLACRGRGAQFEDRISEWLAGSFAGDAGVAFQKLRTVFEGAPLLVSWHPAAPASRATLLCEYPVPLKSPTRLINALDLAPALMERIGEAGALLEERHFLDALRLSGASPPVRLVVFRLEAPVAAPVLERLFGAFPREMSRGIKAHHYLQERVCGGCAVSLALCGEPPERSIGLAYGRVALPVALEAVRALDMTPDGELQRIFASLGVTELSHFALDHGRGEKPAVTLSFERACRG